VDCCVEFITLIASEANDISEREAKKTIACEHVTAALRELGFPEYVGPVQESADEYKKQQAVGGPCQGVWIKTRSLRYSSHEKRNKAKWSRVDCPMKS